jgi:hypothetical protein
MFIYPTFGEIFAKRILAKLFKFTQATPNKNSKAFPTFLLRKSRNLLDEKTLNKRCLAYEL